MDSAKPLDCQEALGMESGAISDVQITASSFHKNQDRYAAYYGRLHLRASGRHSGAWSASKDDVNVWLQIDLNGTHRVTRLATQGRNGNYKQWVTEYQLQFSKNTVSFIFYTGHERNLTKVK